MNREAEGFVNSAVSGCFWFFAPKFWEMAGTHESFFCHSMNAGGDTIR